MPAMRQNLTLLYTLGVFGFSSLTSSAAEQIGDRLDSIERRLARVETAIQLPAEPTTRPTTQPEITPVRADTQMLTANGKAQQTTSVTTTA